MVRNARVLLTAPKPKADSTSGLVSGVSDASVRQGHVRDQVFLNSRLMLRGKSRVLLPLWNARLFLRTHTEQQGGGLAKTHPQIESGVGPC